MGPLSAGVILSTVPVAVLFSFLQRHLIHGLTREPSRASHLLRCMSLHTV
jgi:ABC-type glycerol-3-phosphate transport system permease component